MSTVSYSDLIKSPSDVSSRSVSPVILRPTVTPRQKQRSSSMNSVSSCQSTHHRSMSIVSVESQRNSIVSVEDFPTRPTRENSTSSLVSLGMTGSPMDPAKDLGISNRLPRLKTKSCALFSDEESSEPEQSQMLARAGAWGRRRSSDKVHKPDFLLSFKNNFKFKYDGYVKPKLPASATSSKSEDSMPSPLSSAIDSSNSHLTHHLSSLDHEPLASPSPKLSGSSSSKKVRSSSMTQSMFLKRKLLFSKDLQLELLSGHTSTTAFPANNHDIRSPSHFLLHQGADRSISPDDTSRHHDREALPSSQNPTSLKAQQATFLLPPPHGHPHLHHSFTSSTSSISPPTELTLNQQNKLISELNRKWNRSMYSPSMDIYAQHEPNPLDFAASRVATSKKRGRSESSSSADSLTTNFS